MFTMVMSGLIILGVLYSITAVFGGGVGLVERYIKFAKKEEQAQQLRLFKQPTTVEGEDGELYIGKLYQGKRHGRGELDLPNGDRYKGEFRLGEINGRGEYRYSNGDLFRGKFKNSKKEGVGDLYLYDNKAKISGLWSKGKKDGLFTYNNIDPHTNDLSLGKTYEAEFQEDKLIHSKEIAPQENS